VDYTENNPLQLATPVTFYRSTDGHFTARIDAPAVRPVTPEYNADGNTK
jgi:hypothetical protein